RGKVIAQGDHMPVHLGSMPMAVASALKQIDLGPGDVVALNDPFAGGTHLPDVTLVMGVFGGDREIRRHGDTAKLRARRSTSPRLRLSASPRPLFYVA